VEAKITEQFCPICGVSVDPSERYPRYVCSSCSQLAETADGNRLRFETTEPLGGGFAAYLVDSGEVYDSHTCYIKSRECRADEARFGGIIVQVVENH